MEEMFTMIHNHDRNPREELLFNSGRASRKPCTLLAQMLHQIKSGTFCCKIIQILKPHHNICLLSNLFNRNLMKLCSPTTLDMSHITSWHTQASTLTVMLQELAAALTAFTMHGKLGDKMEGRFNQDLPDNMQRLAFEKAINSKPRVLTKQCINTRRVNEVNHIDVSSDYQEFEVNEAHVRNPNYKGKNYDPHYQENKQNTKSNSNNSHQSSSGYKENNYTSGGNLNNVKNDYTEKPANVQVTLTGPMNKDQLFKIQEILRNSRVYRDKLPKR